MKIIFIPLGVLLFAVAYFLIWNLLLGFILLIGYIIWNFHLPDIFDVFDWFVFDLNKIEWNMDYKQLICYKTIFHWAFNVIKKINKI